MCAGADDVAVDRYVVALRNRCLFMYAGSDGSLLLLSVAPEILEAHSSLGMEFRSGLFHG